MKKLQSYKILKLNSNDLKKDYKTEGKGNNYEVNLSLNKAVKKSCVISISESQLTRHLDKMGCICKEKFITKNGRKKSKPYIADLVSIEFNKDNDVFTTIKNNCLRKREENKYGLNINGCKFSRLSTPSGSGRKSVSFYVSNDIKDEINKKLMNGLILEELEMNGSKFNAYFGLCVSSGHEVSTPRVCVIGDFEHFIDIDCDFVNKKYEIQDNKKQKAEKNCFDGMGIIDPIFAEEVWSKDVGCDYTPCCWVIRCSFLKGAVFNFDFKKWWKEQKGKTTITNIYGKEYPIDEIDIILTKSQFKMADAYNKCGIDSWEYYRKCCDENNNKWSVSKINAKEEKEYGTTNYQFLQTTNLSIDDIKSFCQPSIDEIEEYFENPQKALELISYGDDDKEPPYVKALKLYDNAIYDPYIVEKIQEVLQGRIKDMCLGRLKVRDNHQFMISDPIAFMEWAFYRNPDKVKGFLKRDEYYSNYWLDNDVKEVLAIRSPNIHFSEHNILNFIDRNKWFKYLTSGVIYNIWGDDQIRHSGSDWDGDTAFYTTSPEMIHGIIKSNIIEFNHPKPPVGKLTESALFEADKTGFGVDIGTTINYVTNAINLEPKFKENKKAKKELTKRIKLLTVYGQQTIDAQKGCEVLPIPKYWYDYQSILNRKYYLKKAHNECFNKFGKTLEQVWKQSIHTEEEQKILDNLKDNIKNNLDSKRTIRRKNFDNRILLNISPYFLRYRYKNKYQEWEEYIKSTVYNHPAEKPLNDCDSVMNLVCKYIESFEYQNKISKNIKKVDIDKKWYSLMIDSNIEKNEERFKKVLNVYKNYIDAKKSAYNISCNDWDNKDTNNIMPVINDYYQNEFLVAVENNVSELANYLVEILYPYKTKRKGALWNFAGDAVVKHIDNNLKLENKNNV